MAEPMETAYRVQEVQELYKKRCGCKGDCLSFFPEELIAEQYLAIKEVSKEEKDLILIGQIRAQRYDKKLQYAS